MRQIFSALALAAAGALVGSAGANAAQADTPATLWHEAAMAGPSVGLGSGDSQRDVIEPPSSIDPGMSFDPPQTGAKMPILRPPATLPHGLILPR